MNKFIINIKNSLLFKVASLNSVSTGVKIVTGLLTSKIIAVIVGAEGLAFIGNFRNFLSSTQSISTLGIYSGVVKYVSENKRKAFVLSKTISSTVYSVLLVTVIVALFCYFNADYLNDLIFSKEVNHAYVFKVLAISLPFYSLNVIIISVINGLSKYKTILKINIFGQVLVTLITLTLIWKIGLKGALIAMAIGESLLFFVSVLWLSKDFRFLKLIKIKKINFNSLKQLSSFSIMALFTATISPLVIFLIRTYIIDTIGEQDAGFWEAMRRISNYYLLFVSSLLALYILPRFSEINSNKEFRNEVFEFYKRIVPIFIFGLILIYVLRTFIISLIFTEEFQPVEQLFLWQQIGDVIKVLALVISYQFLAKKMLWLYLITETISYLLLYFLSIYFINQYGVKGATIAHCVTYACYYSIILLIFWKPLFGNLPEQNRSV